MLNMMKICEILEMDNIEKGDAIKLSDKHKDNVFFLKRGSVKIVNTKNDSVKYIVKRGNIFGELALYNKEIAAEEVAYALEDCVICYIDSKQMEELMEKHKSLKNGVLKIYGLRIKKLERRLSDLLYKDSATRIEEFILEYIEEFGEKNEADQLVAKKLLSHKEIANLTNTSRQTVSNILSVLRKKGIINYDINFISADKPQQTQK